MAHEHAEASRRDLRVEGKAGEAAAGDGVEHRLPVVGIARLLHHEERDRAAGVAREAHHPLELQLGRAGRVAGDLAGRARRHQLEQPAAVVGERVAQGPQLAPGRVRAGDGPAVDRHVARGARRGDTDRARGQGLARQETICSRSSSVALSLSAPRSPMT